MFFFFPFYAESKPSYSGRSSPRFGTLPLLPAPASARSRDADRAGDFGGFGVDLIRQTISAFTSSLTALGNQANALFAQVAAALAFDRSARDTVSFIDAAWRGFGAPKAPTSLFGSWPSQTPDPMSFSPFLTQGFNPLATNPWAAFAEGMNFWKNLWMPGAPQRNPYSFGSSTPAKPFMTKVSTPWGFSWGV